MPSVEQIRDAGDRAQCSEIGTSLTRCRERLAGAPPLNLPLDHPRPPQQRMHRSTVPIELDADTGRSLRATARDHGATLFALLVTAYAYWLRSYSEQDDIVFATVHDPGWEAGPAAAQECRPTPVLLRVHVPEAATCTGLLTTVRAELLDSIRCAVPLERLVAALNPPLDERLNPVFQTAVLFDPAMLRPDPAPSEECQLEALGSLVNHSKLDISVAIRESGDGRLDGRLTYDTDLFEAGTARLMRDHFVGLLQCIAAAPELPLSDLCAPDAADRHAQISTFNPMPLPAATALEDRCIHELIADRAAHSPDQIAVVVGEQRLSYRQLLSRAQRTAARLTEAGAGPGVIVAISSERTIDKVPALLGTLLCGAAYLPLNPRQPESRSLFMMADAGAKVLLTDSPHRLGAVPPDVAAVNLAEDVGPGPGDAAPKYTDGRSTPRDLAYVIYTSGSTGQPKGVQVEHHSVVNLMATLPVALGQSDADVHVSVTSYAFDGSVGDIFATLGLGATLVLATTAETTDPRALASLIERCGATSMSATPTTWSMLISAGWPGRPGLLAVCAGEPLPHGLAAKLQQRCRAVWNGWGPTEGTVFAGGGFVQAGEPINVGRPLPGVRIYVMNGQGQLVRCGVPGEIVIAGRGISRGYLNRADQTARQYGADPFTAGDRIYRTGDRGRLLADGRLQHLGRYDDQVKIRGFRIELGEIESVLVEHPNISEVAATVVRSAGGQEQLAAYVVAGAAGLDHVELRKWARRQLPADMVPGHIVELPALPKSLGGKVNRAALPLPPASSVAMPTEVGPKTLTERLVWELWSELLPGKVADSHSDFFELGGDSVLAARLLIELERRTGVAIAVVDFVQQGTTLAGVASLLDRAAASQPGPPPQRIGTRPLFVVYPDLNSAFSVRHMIDAPHFTEHVQPLILPLLLGPIGRSPNFEEMTHALVRGIRTVQPDGPYRLIGYSFGGLMAYEVGRRLQADGENVTWLGLLDAPTPAAARLIMERGLMMERQMSLMKRLSRLRRWSHASKVAMHHGHNLRERLIEKGVVRRRSDEKLGYRHMDKVMRDRTVVGHAVPMSVFATTEMVMWTESDNLGWADVHQGPLAIHTTPGNHESMLTERFAGELTALLSASLSEMSAGSRIPTSAAALAGPAVEEPDDPQPVGAGTHADA